MRSRLGIIAALACAILGAAGAPAAEAAHWPAHCTTLRCINGHLNALHTEDLALQAVNKKQNKTINNLIGFDGAVVNAFNCILNVEEPITVGGGNALTLTTTGLTPTFWTLTDSCNTSPAVASKAFRPGIGGLGRWLERMRN
jgi:hypothetical protein